MNSTPEFRGEVHQNLHLCEGGREVHAVIIVDAEAGAWSSAAAEVLIIDSSGSMADPPEKIAKAREAAAAAIDELRDGVAFAVIAGSQGARMLWPSTRSLVPADPRTRAEAKDALRRLGTGGGTTIGQWLRLAGELLDARPDAIRHAILLTDGKNQHEPAGDLVAALRGCEGVFSCDCRGLGTDWSVGELRMIASALQGTVGIVPEPAGLAEDFRIMMATSMDKTVAEVGMRLWTPEGATVRSVTQVAPTTEDLTGRRVDSGPLTGDYPTGSWGTESRHYHVCVDVDPMEVGEEKLACRATFVEVQADGAEQVLNQEFLHTEPDYSTNLFPHARVRAFWTDDIALSTRIHPQVAVATGQVELARAVQEGLDAHQRGDRGRATARLCRARELAEQVGNENVLTRLEQLYDPETGTFRLDSMSVREEMELDLGSTRTAPVRRR
ncbi:MAG: VWA domain-containing protein [Pseudonocardiaceae bacterium]